MSDKYPVHAVITGIFSAPPDEAFSAFLDTRQIGQFMFGPCVRDEEIISLTNEPVVGGKFAYSVRRQGKQFDHVGEYLAIDRPRHLAFTWSVKQDPTGGVSRIVIDIAPILEGCELTLTHQMPPGSEDFTERSKEAWGKMLDVLTEVLA
ncbi:SRPBCC domain-containing protein [Chitinophaga filiformis]|uniref:SRPBCC family protein n=1 Tax=Chitinophaga filiformis TaxID=104663 RepID=UPI001F459C46|nr:SRPBCC family protein [Chitinophaga filiformis]MCF6406426.1 SRPBCC domain-containing protein [Chitinophaga filiformis]